MDAKQEECDVTKFISGRYIELSNSRLVLVGILDDSNTIAIGFRNLDGEVIKLGLSKEAAASLGELLTNPLSGTHTDDSAILRDTRVAVYRWTAVVKDKDTVSINPDDA